MSRIEDLLSKLPKTVEGSWLNIERSDGYLSWYGHSIGRKIFKGNTLEESLTLLLEWCVENKYIK